MVVLFCFILGALIASLDSLSHIHNDHPVECPKQTARIGDQMLCQKEKQNALSGCFKSKVSLQLSTNSSFLSDSFDL